MDQVIVNNIKQTLVKLEKERNIKILLAVESGSRAWGFPSIDSDYDCRFVYVKAADDYLTIEEGADYIGLPIDAIYDVDGWDLKKSLIHVYKSNPTAWEWLQSPVVYKEEEGFKEECLAIAGEYFNEKSALYHYKSLAYNKLKDIEGKPEAMLKPYFYALRSSIACDYIMKHHQIPPMKIDKLINGVSMNPGLIEEVEKLIKVKETVDESYMMSVSQSLLSYMKEILKACDVYLENLKFKPKHGDQEPLNELFRKWIKSF